MAGNYCVDSPFPFFLRVLFIYFGTDHAMDV
jgi:hypothetical protein